MALDGNGTLYTIEAGARLVAHRSARPAPGRGRPLRPCRRGGRPVRWPPVPGRADVYVATARDRGGRRVGRPHRGPSPVRPASTRSGGLAYDPRRGALYVLDRTVLVRVDAGGGGHGGRPGRPGQPPLLRRAGAGRRPAVGEMSSCSTGSATGLARVGRDGTRGGRAGHRRRARPRRRTGRSTAGGTCTCGPTPASGCWGAPPPPPKA